MKDVMWIRTVYFSIFLFMITGCSQKESQKYILANIAPGHFHASLIQKSMYDQIDPEVYVYAPDGPEIKSYLASIDQYNTRSDNPTAWNLQTFIGPDYLEKMRSAKKANILITAGNNARKLDYIGAGLEAGMHILSDKPMCIDAKGFSRLQEYVQKAAQENLLLYDIMTERSEITTILQKELSQQADVFGELITGTIENPAVSKESVHHFFKYVSGKALKRPAWYFDTNQQGEGITDVTTHLVDLIQWECLPDTEIDFKNDVKILSARRWPTKITPAQFEQVTGNVPAFPDFLKSAVDEFGDLSVYANGQINYTLRGIHARVSVRWNFQAPDGAADTHFSVMRGSKSNLIIKQGEEQNYKPELYIQPVPETNLEEYRQTIRKSFKDLENKFPGIELVAYQDHWRVKIPDLYRVGHEAHFSQVTERFLSYLAAGKLPAWETSYILAKYYTTTAALTLALQTAE